LNLLNYVTYRLLNIINGYVNYHRSIIVLSAYSTIILWGTRFFPQPLAIDLQNQRFFRIFEPYETYIFILHKMLDLFQSPWYDKHINHTFHVI